MTTGNKITVKEILALMRSALKEFGTYTYDDKGPHEVMDIDEIAGRIRALGVEEAATLLKALRASGTGKRRAREIERCWSSIMVTLQDWDEFMEGPVEADEELQDF